MPETDDWVMLAYRLPRVPSTPRSTVWRRLKRLGVLQVTDGLVALPRNDVTQEALEWVAEEVQDNGGQAMLWFGHPADRAGRASLRERLGAAVVEEYRGLAAEASRAVDLDSAGKRRAQTRLRRQLQQIQQRDFFGADAATEARVAVERLVVRTPVDVGRGR